METKYYLGFDAGCQSCSRISVRLAELVGDEIEILPLQSARMFSFREKIGKIDTWAPTLIREQGNEVQGWTGWQMGPQLIQLVGVPDSIRLLALVGEESNSKPIFENRFRRRSFLTSVVTVTLGAAALTRRTFGPSATASTRSYEAFDGLGVPDYVRSLLSSTSAEQLFTDTAYGWSHR